MNNKLYVGNLSFKTSEVELDSLFSSNGKVLSSRIITDKESGRSKGFGFVEMESNEDAQKAIASLHESEQDGRKIVVNIARPMEKRNNGFRTNRSW